MSTPLCSYTRIPLLRYELFWQNIFDGICDAVSGDRHFTASEAAPPLAFSELQIHFYHVPLDANLAPYASAKNKVFIYPDDISVRFAPFRNHWARHLRLPHADQRIVLPFQTCAQDVEVKRLVLEFRTFYFIRVIRKTDHWALALHCKSF